MCNPAALIVAGTVVKMGGQVMGGIYQMRMANYRAKVAEQNKQLAREGAEDAIALGQDEQRRLGRETAQRVGSQRARMSANNVDVGFGSAARVTDDTSMVAREESDAISENTRRRVKSMQIDAWNFENEKRTAQAEKSGARSAMMWSVASTALGGASQYSEFRSKQNG